MARPKKIENEVLADTKEKRIADLKAKMEKDYGKGALIGAKDKSIDIEAISTGSIGLDKALGIGGLPKGRIIEVYGPESSGKTTLCQSVIACAHAADKNSHCAIIDAEHALDLGYAMDMGIDLNRLEISQPDYGEQALEIARKLVKSGDFDVIVIDSVAALVPKSELEGEIGDAGMGKQARMMSQALRILTPEVEKSKTIVIFTNQLRDKIGVMFGCLHADMPVVFTDGRSFPIRKVVEEKIKGNVWSWNEKESKFEEKEVTDWHYNGNVNTNDDYIHIETTGINSSRFGITVTPNHKILTDSGWKEAKYITLKDKLISKYKSVLDNNDFIKGCLVGDSHLSLRAKNTASLVFQDSLNEEYVKWKTDVLNFMNFKKSGKKYKSDYTYELAKIKKEIQNRNPLLVFKDGIISDLSLAVWIMDDGNFCHERKRYSLSVKRFSKNEEVLNGIVKLFKDNGIIGNCYDKKSILFNKENSLIIANRISKYVPSSMEYKLPISHIFSDTENMNIKENIVIKSDFVDILNIRKASNRQMRQKGKYDISIRDNHNYLSGGKNNGVIVHNSPETTTGGNALKFYTSVRMDIRKITTNKDGEEAVSNRVRVKVIKNKVAPPFRQTEFNLVFGKGIDKFAELIELAVNNNVIKKSGSWFSYGEDKIGQGFDSVTELLEDNPGLFEEIKKKTLEVLNPTVDEKLILVEAEKELVNELTNELIEEDNESENQEISE